MTAATSCQRFVDPKQLDLTGRHEQPTSRSTPAAHNNSSGSQAPASDASPLTLWQVPNPPTKQRRNQRRPRARTRHAFRAGLESSGSRGDDGVVGHRWRASWILDAIALMIAACSSTPAGSGAAEKLADEPLDTVITLSSRVFAEGDPIPSEFSCEGEDVSPPLSWEGVPGEAMELALVVDDPDASGGTYVHRVLFGLDPSLTGLQAGVTPTGGRQAENSAGDAIYKGPCPPGGDPHHYRFTVYTLREGLAADDGADAGELLGQVQEVAIAKGTLTGTFAR